MSKTFDTIVLGLGAMGSSSVYHLAKKGVKVLGLEQFTPAHDRGSSHGRTRVIRQSYYEDPAYVPLLLRAYELWRKLEVETGQNLLFEVGGLMIGTETSSVFSGSLRSALTHDLPHEVLNASEITRRYPSIKPEAGLVALFEKRAGFVLPEKCILAHLSQARRSGADLRFEEKVLRWEATPDGEGVRVETTRGQYEAARLIISPGAWAPEVLTQLGVPFEVQRQVLYWLEPRDGTGPFDPERFPIFIWETEDGFQPYGFPALDGPDGGVKVAFYRAPVAEPCTPENMDRTVHEGEIETMKKTIGRLVPSLDSRCVAAATCLYTMTPDKNFIVSHHPRHRQVIVGCGFSGHGFKFSSAVGEILSDLAVTGSTEFDVDFLNPKRFLGGP